MTRKSGPRRRCLMQRFCQSGEPDQEDTRLAASGNLWSAPDRAVIGLVEAGEANPGVEVVSRLRVALKCKWDDLMRGL